MNNEIKYVSPFKRFCITVGNLPTAYLESMSYYEGLTYLVNYLSNNVIPALNNNSAVVEELQEQFIILKNYVDNYFENLDVQEEINNKLDDMAEKGELTDIIAQYLGLAGMITFDNVNEMKNAENLVNGSKCQTLGYYNVNDGGNALYKVRTITNDDVVDDQFIIELYDNNLIAELIIDNFNIKQIGAKGDGINDDTLYFQNALSKTDTINVPNGHYILTNTLDVNSKNIYGESSTNTIIDETTYTTPREHIIIFSGSNNVKNITFIKTFSGNGDYKLSKIAGFINCYNSLFENVLFKSDGYITGATIDLYSNNHNISFINCTSYLYSKDSDNNNEEGGLWIREHESDKTTENIIFDNCYIYSQSVDEAIAIWNWYGTIKDIFINNCKIESPTLNTAPHFISLGGDNIQFNNCNLLNSTIQSSGFTNKISSIFHASGTHTGNAYINNCIIKFNTQLQNALCNNEQTGNFLLNNCEITNGNYNTPLGNGIYKSCNLTAGIITVTNSKLYNCILNYLDTEGDYKIAQSGFEAYNTIFNNIKCEGTIFIQIFTTNSTIIIKDCKFNGTFTPLHFIFVGSNYSLAKLEVINTNIAGISGSSRITSGLINNCTAPAAITSLTNLVVNNVIAY